MDRFNDFFQLVSGTLDIAEIRRQWLALSPEYNVGNWRLPLPLWAQRPYDQSGPAVWETLRHTLKAAAPTRPISIYLHVPFCSSKCGFCDSYSFKLGSHQSREIEKYVDRLCGELNLWSAQGNLRSRPVSTVHMGGGTPTFMGETYLRKVVETCKSCYQVSDETEWALESTVESLTPGMIAAMHELGYRRLHVGVQSLQPDVRQAIGRRCPPDQVMKTIETTLGMGWVVSVDLVIGLPFQTLQDFLSDLQALQSIGVNGFSLYELLIYPQNRRWAQNYHLLERDHLNNYWMFQAGASWLADHGYSKNLFNHWADRRDANVYFTFPTRAEDCLAIGTIADGVFGEYHYRHPRYAAYMQTAGDSFPGLEGGLRRNALENKLLPITSAIMASCISRAAFEAIMTLPGGDALVKRWLANGLIGAEASNDYPLTASGAWFTGNMVYELKTLAQSGMA